MLGSREHICHHDVHAKMYIHCICYKNIIYEYHIACTYINTVLLTYVYLCIYMYINYERDIYTIHVILFFY